MAASAHPGGANRSPEGACDCLSLPRSANGQTGENHFLIVLIILREFKIFISRAPTRPEFALGERGSCCTAHFFQTLPPGPVEKTEQKKALFQYEFKLRGRDIQVHKMTKTDVFA